MKCKFADYARVTDMNEVMEAALVDIFCRCCDRMHDPHVPVEVIYLLHRLRNDFVPISAGEHTVDYDYYQVNRKLWIDTVRALLEV